MWHLETKHSCLGAKSAFWYLMRPGSHFKTGILRGGRRHPDSLPPKPESSTHLSVKKIVTAQWPTSSCGYTLTRGKDGKNLGHIFLQIQLSPWRIFTKILWFNKKKTLFSLLMLCSGKHVVSIPQIKNDPTLTFSGNDGKNCWATANDFKLGLWGCPGCPHEGATWAEGVWPFTPPPPWPRNKTVNLSNQLHCPSRHHEGIANQAKRKVFSYLLWFGLLSQRFLPTSHNGDWTLLFYSGSFLGFWLII